MQPNSDLHLAVLNVTAIFFVWAIRTKTFHRALTNSNADGEALFKNADRPAASRSPSAKSRPLRGNLAGTGADHLVVVVLGGGRASVIGQDAHERPYR